MKFTSQCLSLPATFCSSGLGWLLGNLQRYLVPRLFELPCARFCPRLGAMLDLVEMEQNSDSWNQKHPTAARKTASENARDAGRNTRQVLPISNPLALLQ